MSAETPKFIRVGDNPEQSLVRPLINKTSELLGIDGLRVEPYELDLDPNSPYFTGLFYEKMADLADKGMLGASVTMPLTTRVIPEFIATDSRRIEDKYIGLLGAVDTITTNPGDPERPWSLKNTDAIAVSQTLEGYGIRAADRNFLIFGAGGAARAAAFAVAQQKPANIVIANRNPSNADSLVDDLELVANRKSRSDDSIQPLTTGIQAVELGDLDSDTPVANWTVSSADVVINGTPIGQRGHSAENEMPLSQYQLATVLRPGAVILDTVYDPPRTPLIRSANPVGRAWVPFREDIVAKNFKVIEGTQWALHKAMSQFVEFNDALVRSGESSPLTDQKISLAQELMTEILAKEISRRNSAQ